MSTLPLLLLVCSPGAEAVPAFVLLGASGEPRTGSIERVAADWSTTLSGSPPVAGSEVIALRRAGTVLPAWPRTGQLQFANGDRLAGEPIHCDGRTLRFRPTYAGPATAALAVPLSRVSILWLAAPPRVVPDTDARHALLNGPRRRDAVVMRNGDVLSGDLAGLDAKTTRLQTTQEQSVPNAKVAAIAFNTELVRNRPPKGVWARLVLADGSRLTLMSASGDARGLAGQTEFKETVQVTWEQVVSLDLFQGRAVYLSDLKPKRYEFTPYLAEGLNWMADRNVGGGPLALRGQAGVSYFDKGVGVHSRCTLGYGLDKKYRRFEALVGLDDELGQKGAVAVRVLVDGREAPLPDLKRLTHRGGPREVVLDVRGAATLVIEVDWGEGGHVGDAVNLAEARLILDR